MSDRRLIRSPTPSQIALIAVVMLAVAIGLWLGRPRPVARLASQAGAQILAAARRLFAEQPYTSFSTADVAREAGVTRSLVHHYFGGIRAVFVAVAAELGTALSDVRTAGPETPLEERIARNVAAALDVVDANRETWRAAVGHGAARADPDLRPFMLAADEQSVERMLQANKDRWVRSTTGDLRPGQTSWVYGRRGRRCRRWVRGCTACGGRTAPPA